MIARRLVCALAWLCASAGIAGCETGAYYLQAARGQWALSSAARPIEDWLADPATPEPLRERLRLAQRMRSFATQELALPDNSSYTRYAELDRPYVVWNVFAAEEFSVEAKRECFPIAGCVVYRGFFAESDAREHAARLRGEGYDSYVAGVAAYSTLGWLGDPLLSTFVKGSETELARLMFHELAHQKLYVRDDSRFNESFAVAVEREGIRRWLEREGRSEALSALLAARQRGAEVISHIAVARESLRKLYAADMPSGEMRQRKAEMFAKLRSTYRELRATGGGSPGFDRIFEQEPNNALLAAFATYTQLVPAFEKLLAAAGGDLTVFYARAKELADLPPVERTRALEARN